MGDHHDPVSRRNPCQCDKADQGGNREHAASQIDTYHCSDKRERNGQHDLKAQIGTAEMCIKRQEHANDRENAQDQDIALCFGLVFKLAFIADVIAGW